MTRGEQLARELVNRFAEMTPAQREEEVERRAHLVALEHPASVIAEAAEIIYVWVARDRRRGIAPRVWATCALGLAQLEKDAGVDLAAEVAGWDER